MYRVIVPDLDNCFFHQGYIRHSNRPPEHVIQINRSLLDSIKNDPTPYTELIVMMGSARQSNYCDIQNSITNKTESGFIALKKISIYLNARLDPFLLADVHGNRPDGTSFNNATNPSYKGKHDHTLHDKTKIIILYAQMHKIASLYPNDQIIFDFYDDKGNNSWQPIDILEHIETYFNAYPQMIPNNVTLRLHHYERKELTPFKPITGNGKIDKDYRQTIKNMTKLAKNITPLPHYVDFFERSVFHVTPEHLASYSKSVLNINACFRSMFCFFYASSEKTCEEKTTPLLDDCPSL